MCETAFSYNLHTVRRCETIEDTQWGDSAGCEAFCFYISQEGGKGRERSLGDTVRGEEE